MGKHTTYPLQHHTCVFTHCPHSNHNDNPLSKQSKSWAEERLALIVQAEAARSGIHREWKSCHVSQIQCWQRVWWVSSNYWWRSDINLQYFENVFWHFRVMGVDQKDLSFVHGTQQYCNSATVLINVFFTWTFSPFYQALFDLWDLRAGFTEGRWVLQDLPCARLLAPLETTGSTRPRAGAPLTPLTHLAVHWQGKKKKGKWRWEVWSLIWVTFFSSSLFATCSHSTSWVKKCGKGPCQQARHLLTYSILMHT